jgi:hypothetical protein
VDTPEDLERVSRLFEASVISSDSLKRQFEATREVH